MDGTGELFSQLQSSLPAYFHTEVIPLASLSDGGFKQQALVLAKHLGQEPCMIFAESYSGNIAYQLCQMRELNIEHVFFAASFLSKPSIISGLAQFAPLFLLRLNLIPKCILSGLFFGSFKRIDLVNQFLEVLKKISDSTLKKRLQNIATLTPATDNISVPCTYICAKNDTLVSKKVIKTFTKVCSNLETFHLEGGHFIAQCNPEQCAMIINKVAQSK